MPITKSAKKALRQGSRRKAGNDRAKKAMKDAEKKIEKFVSAGKKDEAKKSLGSAYAIIDKALKKGVIKKNTGARKKSRLARITK